MRVEFRQLAAQAGVRRRFAPHQLRHAHAVELAREGVPLNVIQRQLGHANLGTTSHLPPRDRHRGDHRHRPRQARTDDVRHRRTQALTTRPRTAGSIDDYTAQEERATAVMEQGQRARTDPRTVADTVLRIIRSKAPAPHYLVGREKWLLRLTRILPPSAIESLMSRRTELSR